MSVSSKFSIRTSTGNYDVEISPLSTIPQDLLWLIDANVARLHADHLPRPAIIQQALESEKCLETVAHVIEQMRDHGCTRQTTLAAVGGGIVQDIATFAASCYMRGIPWVYYPTTLLSMVDSCIGGKSSINVSRYKNIAGNFYPPRAVHIDPTFCRTLSDEQMVEGLCEAAKICWADSDASFLQYLELANGLRLQDDSQRLVRLIEHCLRTKKRFIEEDEFDQGVRLLLNFGHTFGHALESSSQFTISHGVAVGLGMLAAAHLSRKRGLIGPETGQVKALIAHVHDLMNLVDGLRARLRAIDPDRAMEAFLSDKKHGPDYLTIIIFNTDGRLKRVHAPRDETTLTELRDTFQFICESYNEIQ